MRNLIGKIAASLLLVLVSAAASATTLNTGYWWVYYYGATQPSQGPAVEWGPIGVPTDFTLAQASQSGDRVVLKPNTNLCGDQTDDGGRDYWCYTPDSPDKGKWLVAATYEETAVPVGPESTIPFSGCFVSNTLTDHSITAFVKVLSGDYTQTWYEEYDSSGSFNLPATLAGDAAAVVQVGFQMSGPTVHPDQIDDYGSVVVDMGGACPAPPVGDADPNAIPALPLGGLLGLIGLVGWLGVRRRV